MGQCCTRMLRHSEMESPTIRSGTQFLEILCETRDATQLGDTRESLKMYFSSEMNEITVSVTLDR